MECGINMSFVNRQVILHRIREVFSQVFKQSGKFGKCTWFMVAHNAIRTAYSGWPGASLLHRKGATRAFGPGMSDLSRYRDIGQPVIIGSMMGHIVVVGVLAIRLSSVPLTVADVL